MQLHGCNHLMTGRKRKTFAMTSCQAASCAICRMQVIVSQCPILYTYMAGTTSLASRAVQFESQRAECQGYKVTGHRYSEWICMTDVLQRQTGTGKVVSEDCFRSYACTSPPIAHHT